VISDNQQFNYLGLGGVLLFSMAVLSLTTGLFPTTKPLLIWPIGLLVIVSVALLVTQVGRGPRIQVGLLLLIGIVLLIVSIQKGVSVSFIDTLTRNVGLVTMLLSVGFLKMIVIPERESPSDITTGPNALAQTLFSVALFGSMINISAPVLIAERLHARRPLDLFAISTICRVFSPCASWSPFFMGMAVVLVYIPELGLMKVMLTGFPFAVIATVLAYWIACQRHPERVEAFEGYPLKVSSLWVPALLAICVVAASQLFPALSIVVVIALSALLLTVAVLIVRRGIQSGLASFYDHILRVLPGSVNEVILFVSAGVLAAGLTGLVDAGMLDVPFQTFTPVTAAVLLGAMILISAIGVHPLIQISGLAPLVLVASPAPDLLASTFLFAWSLGTCGSPLSGTNLMFQAKFGIPAWRIATCNWPFIGLMYVVAIMLLLVSGSL